MTLWRACGILDARKHSTSTASYCCCCVVALSASYMCYFGGWSKTNRHGNKRLRVNDTAQYSYIRTYDMYDRCKPIYRLFLNKVLAKNNQQRRVHTRTSSLHQSISAHTHMGLCRWGKGKHAVCASREEGCLPPRSRRSRAPPRTCRRRRLSSASTKTSSSVSVFGECCNRDRDESGKAFVVVTITIRSHRHVVRPEVCASE